MIPLINKETLQNKKIGIWGLGVVGTSILKYLKNVTSQIQILDAKNHESIFVTLQTPESTEKFLNENDFIFPSPGINLNPYAAYAHKFICELDIFETEFKNKTIAITGTLGKTTITSFIQQCIPGAMAAGNIGLAMLDILLLAEQPSAVILELSSYQLQYAKSFAPDIAIMTNFYPNHLDHHATVEEYFSAKCNILKHQKAHQIALIPAETIDQTVNTIDIKSQIYLFATDKPNTAQKYPIFYICGDAIMLEKNGVAIKIFDGVSALPSTTFVQNWIIILSTLHLFGINAQSAQSKLSALNAPEHRIEFVKKLYDVHVYNDSKSTLWQATKSALEKFPQKRIALMLGGVSKGTDRTPLIAYIAAQSLTAQKNITIFGFGKEAEIIGAMCKEYAVPYAQAETLGQSLSQFTKQHKNFDVLLFSPAGASFDLFKNYQDRGTQFKNMVHAIKQN